MMVGEFLRMLVAEVKKDTGLDASYDENRIIGVGHRYVFKVWSDPESKKVLSIGISDETFADKTADEIMDYIKKCLNDFVDTEFLK